MSKTASKVRKPSVSKIISSDKVSKAIISKNVAIKKAIVHRTGINKIWYIIIFLIVSLIIFAIIMTLVYFLVKPFFDILFVWGLSVVALISSVVAFPTGLLLFGIGGGFLWIPAIVLDVAAVIVIWNYWKRAAEK